MPKSIIFIINSIKTGGAEKILLNLIRTYHNLGYTTKLITLLKSTDIPEIPSKTEWIDLSVYGYPQKILKLKTLITRGYKVISFLTLSNILTLISASFADKKTKIYISIRNDPYKENVNTILKLLGRLIYHRAEKVVVQTEKIKADLIGKNIIGKLNIEIIPNFIPLKECKYLNENVESEIIDKKKKEPLIFLSVGTKLEQKGFIELITLFNELETKKNIKTPILKIVGLNLSEISLIKEKFQIKRNVKLIPLTKSINKYYNSSDYYILNSRFEGFPNTLLECINYKVTPIMKSNVSGVDEIKSILHSAELFNSIEDLKNIILKTLDENIKISDIEFLDAQLFYSEKRIMKMWHSLLK